MAVNVLNEVKLLEEVCQVDYLAYERTQCSDSYIIEICKFRFKSFC